MKAAKIAIVIAILLGFGTVLAQEQVGPNWPTDKYKAFAEAVKKKKLLFLYYTSTT